MESIDQLGNHIRLKKVPKRIVSLVPSQSEFLWDLGLQTELLGITKFCIHPKLMYKNTMRVGGTKNPDIEKIKSLAPDIIIGNKEENEKSVIEELSKDYPVWMSDVNTPEQALDMMTALGALLGKQNEASQLLSKVEDSIKRSKNIFNGERVAYFIWNDPYYFAGSHTFIHSVLKHAGFSNVLEAYPRYPEKNLDELRTHRPEYCFLSSEPYPFKEEHAIRIKQVLPETKVVFVDGESFSWYGSRLIYLYDYLLKLKTSLYA